MTALRTSCRMTIFFFSSRRRHTRYWRDWSSDVCSSDLEAWYAHIPGLVVACPATPADNKGLLKSAIRCDDPVVYMEHKNLWGLEGEVPDDPDCVVPFEIGRASCRERV